MLHEQPQELLGVAAPQWRLRIFPGGYLLPLLLLLLLLPAAIVVAQFVHVGGRELRAIAAGTELHE